MNTPSWPASLPQYPRPEGWSGGPKEGRVIFDPDVGPPIMRRRTTGETRIYQAEFPPLTTAQRATFEAFWVADLGGGALPFSWRDPVTNEPALWHIIGDRQTYSLSAIGADLHRLSLTLLRRPGTPWWAPYVVGGSSIAPFVVADFAGDIFGLGGGKKALTDMFTVTRAGAATQINADGTISDVPANTARWAWVAGVRHLLVEAAATNLIIWSEQANNAAWTKSASTISADATTAPDSTTTADKLVENTATAGHQIYQSVTITPDKVHTFSRYIKAGERTKGQMTQVLGGDQVYVNFDLAAGTITAMGATGTGIFSDATITLVAHGFYHITLTGIIPGAASVLCNTRMIDAGGNLNYTGDGTSGFYIWGASQVPAPIALSYVKTEAAAVTRNADVVTASLSALDLSAGHSVVAHATMTAAAASGSSIVVEIDTGAIANRDLVYWASGSQQFQMSTILGGVSQGLYQASLDDDLGEAIASAFAVGPNHFQAAENGLVSAVDVVVDYTAKTTLRIGRNASGGEMPVQMLVRDVMMYPGQLASDELVAATA